MEIPPYSFTLEHRSLANSRKNDECANFFDTHVALSLSLSLFASLSLSLFFFPSISMLSFCLSLSLQSDINCLLPNLIRNFRRRDNLTSFLFSLARSSHSCTQGSRSQDFSIHERVSERADDRASKRANERTNATRGHVRLYLFNLYRCVVVRARSSRVFLPLLLSLSLSSPSRLPVADGRGEKV